MEVVDNFERALDHESTDPAYAEGMRMIFRQLLGVLEDSGLEEIKAHKESFDALALVVELRQVRVGGQVPDGALPPQDLEPSDLSRRSSRRVFPAASRRIRAAGKFDAGGACCAN